MEVLIVVCCVVLNVHSNFAIILMERKGLVAFLWFVFLVSGDGSVAMVLSLVCDCGIF